MTRSLTTSERIALLVEGIGNVRKAPAACTLWVVPRQR